MLTVLQESEAPVFDTIANLLLSPFEAGWICGRGYTGPARGTAPAWPGSAITETCQGAERPALPLSHRGCRARSRSPTVQAAPVGEVEDLTLTDRAARAPDSPRAGGARRDVFGALGDDGLRCGRPRLVGARRAGLPAHDADGPTVHDREPGRRHAARGSTSPPAATRLGPLCSSSSARAGSRTTRNASP